MKDINKQIIEWEPMMHRVLKQYNVNIDYEDNLQEMRIVVWMALTNVNPKTMYIENKDTKFSTYLYKLMENRLKNIFKIKYKIKLESLGVVEAKNIIRDYIFKKDKVLIKLSKIELIDYLDNKIKLDYNNNKNRMFGLFKEVENDIKLNRKEKEKAQRRLVNPQFFEDLSFEQQINAIKNTNTADAIRLKVDLEIFYEHLNELDKKIWNLRLEGRTQKDIANKLKEKGINRSREAIKKRLKKINKKFIDFMKEGEL